MTPRLSARGAGVLLAATLVVSCSTGGTPVTQHTSSPSASSPASAPATASAAPTPKSDEDQVRDTVYAFLDAYNTRNWDAYMQLLCNAMREQFTGPAMDMLKKGRADNGLSQIISIKATIDGDRATATIDAQSEVLGRQTIDLPLVREDGWKICKVA
jgi:hypothetical protein